MIPLAERILYTVKTKFPIYNILIEPYHNNVSNGFTGVPSLIFNGDRTIFSNPLQSCRTVQLK